MTSSYREILLHGKYATGQVALVDEEDYAYLSQFKWFLRPSVGGCIGHEGYAIRYYGPSWQRRTVWMHRDIMQAPPGVPVDHRRPGSGLDNRRANLRLVTPAMNARNAGVRRNNKTGYTGVQRKAYSTGRIVYTATIRLDGRARYLGTFPTAEEAAAAYESTRIAFGLLAPGGDDAPEPAGNPQIPAHPLLLRNTSGYRGVSWEKECHGWKAQIAVKGRKYHLGIYADPQEASAAYEAARIRFGLAIEDGSLPDSLPYRVAASRTRPLMVTNKSGYRGVYWDKRQGKWGAQCKSRGKVHFLGYHTDKEAAHEAYEAFRASIQDT